MYEPVLNKSYLFIVTWRLSIAFKTHWDNFKLSEISSCLYSTYLFSHWHFDILYYYYLYNPC